MQTPRSPPTPGGPRRAGDVPDGAARRVPGAAHQPVRADAAGHPGPRVPHGQGAPPSGLQSRWEVGGGSGVRCCVGWGPSFPAASHLSGSGPDHWYMAPSQTGKGRRGPGGALPAMHAQNARDLPQIVGVELLMELCHDNNPTVQRHVEGRSTQLFSMNRKPSHQLSARRFAEPGTD